MPRGELEDVSFLVMFRPNAPLLNASALDWLVITDIEKKLLAYLFLVRKKKKQQNKNVFVSSSVQSAGSLKC